MDERTRAMRPEDSHPTLRGTRERVRRGGVAALYEEDAILAFPPGTMTRGRATIQRLFETMLSGEVHFRREEALPTIVLGDLALTATPAADEADARAQVTRRQPDGSWLRILDRPGFRPALPSASGTSHPAA